MIRPVAHVFRPARRSDDDLSSRIVQAVQGLDLTETPAWNDLDALSTHTEVDGVDAHPDGIAVEGGNFQGLMTVYVALQYGKDRDEGFITSDSIPGEFSGHLDENGKPVIDHIKVDTRRFYE